MLVKFLDDNEAMEMYITGMAGTGKTTKLIEVCKELDRRRVTYQVTAYTHKAKEVLESKLPDSPVSTLHSFLKKRPTINAEAKHNNTLVVSRQYGEPEPLKVLIVDEYSFVGEKDYYSIGDLNIKVIYVGDLNQLPPVGDIQVIHPIEPYHLHLTEVHRQDDGTDLYDTLAMLVRRIESRSTDITLTPTQSLCIIREEEEFMRLYNSVEGSKTLLAYTNARVQAYNTLVREHTFEVGDEILIPAMRVQGKIQNISPFHPDKLQTPKGEVTEDTKFNPFRTLGIMATTGIIYVTVDNLTYATILGYWSYNRQKERLATALTNMNKARKNSRNAYKRYKTFSDYVVTSDSPYATTIHKAQGQEFDYVFLDYSDLSKLRDRVMMNKLMYVALSRAKVKVYIKG